MSSILVRDPPQRHARFPLAFADNPRAPLPSAVDCCRRQRERNILLEAAYVREVFLYEATIESRFYEINVNAVHDSPTPHSRWKVS